MDEQGEFGPYQLLGELGSGGMGVVHQALDRRVPRTVALKILHPAMAADPVYRERFRRESSMLSSVEHPHIVPLYNTGAIDNRLFLDMRFISGDDMQAAVDRRGRMPARRAVAVIDGLADALDFVHERGVLHRDIKPKNVMLAGTRFFPYLLDFGIARAESETSLTQDGTVAGSLEYMAPERFRGVAADRRSDIYALAGVLFMGLTGLAPYAGQNGYLALAAAHIDGPIPRPSDTDPALVPFDEVIARGMAKDVDARYSTGADLAADMQAAFEQMRSEQPVQTGQWSATPKPRPPGDGGPSAPRWSSAPSQQGGSADGFGPASLSGTAAPGATTNPPAPPLPSGLYAPPSPPAQPRTSAPADEASAPPNYHPSAPNWALQPPSQRAASGPSGRRSGTVPTWGWLVLLPAVLAIVSMFLPWFTAAATYKGQTERDSRSLTAWGTIVGGIGTLVIVLGAAAVGWLILRARTPVNKPGGRLAGLATAVGGLIGLALVLVALAVAGKAYPEIAGKYSFSAVREYLHTRGGSLDKELRIGFVLALAAGTVQLVLGIALVVAVRRSAAKPAAGAAASGDASTRSGLPSTPPAYRPGY